MILRVRQLLIVNKVILIISDFKYVSVNNNDDSYSSYSNSDRSTNNISDNYSITVHLEFLQERIIYKNPS